MKFLCSNCKAKYQIPDEKIAGRTLKMDCRRCNTPITIRGDQPQTDDLEAEADDPKPRTAPPPAASASASTRGRTGAGPAPTRPAGAAAGGSSVGAQPSARTTGRSALGADFRRNVAGAGALQTEAPRVTPLDQWHVAINDVPVGPMKRDEIARKIAAGAVTGDSLSWREGFDDWRPLKEVPELAALLRRATAESERPPTGRVGLGRGPAAPAPRAPAPRAPAPGASTRSPTPGAARPAAAARNNVVPIGGRLGASVAPSYDPEDDLPSESEATTVASAADLGLGDFGKPDRDDGEIPAPVEAKRSEPKPAAKGQTGALKPIPPATRPLAVPAKPAPTPPSKPAPAPAPAVAAAPAVDDDFGLPPAEPEPPKRASFAPPPAALAPAPAPMAPLPAPSAPVAEASPPREERRGGLGVGAMMGIGFAMAAGAVLMYGVVQRFILAPPPPTTTVVATVATVAPTTEAPHLAPVDDTPPPSSVATVATPPTSEAPPPSSAVPATTAVHRPATTTTGSAPPPSSGARAATKAPAGDDPFAQFADDGAGPAPIATTTSAHHDDTSATHHASTELTAEQISEVRRAGQRGLTTCWETALRAAGHVDGDVRYDIDISIGTSGRVTSVHARGPTVASLQDCLERGVRRWQFPPSASETQTSFPIVFSAQQ